MISFFRRFLASPWVLGLFALVLLAFLVTGVNTRLSGLGGSAAPVGDVVATIGPETIVATDVEQRAQQIVAEARQQNPSATVAAYVAQGGVEQTVGTLIDATSIALFGQKIGIVASKRLVDAQIASFPAFQGPDGKFQESIYRQRLASLRQSDAGLRKEIVGDLLRRQILAPVSGAAREPLKVALPYAGLLVEKRSGTYGLVPTGAIPAGPAPSEAELQTFYRANLPRYTLPERRSIRYATFGRDTVAAAAAPTEAEIKAAYEQDAASYAAKSERTLSQVVFTGADAQARAAALVAQVKGGANFASAAGANLIKVGEKTQSEFADFASPAVAAAAFAAPVDGISAPAQSPFGWHVVHVDSARTVAGKSLAEVHAAIADQLGKTKMAAALAKLANSIQDQLAGTATFDDVVRKNGLKAVTTPALLPNGQAPGQAGYAAPPEVAPLLKAAFQADPQDPPSVETLRPGEEYAVLALGGVEPVAAQPLAEIHDQVKADLFATAAQGRARATAAAILAKVDAGTPMAAAFAASGVKLPPLQTASGTRIEMSRQQNIPGPARLLFTMVPGKAKLLPAPGNGGWYVVRLDTVQATDPRSTAGLVEQTRSQFNQLLGNEYAQQFANATRALYKPRENDQTIAAIKARLVGTPQ